MKYILDIDLISGYEEIAVMMLDQIVKSLHDRGIIKINKQEKEGKPFFKKIEEVLDEGGFKSYARGGCSGCGG